MRNRKDQCVHKVLNQVGAANISSRKKRIGAPAGPSESKVMKRGDDRQDLTQDIS